ERLCEVVGSWHAPGGDWRPAELEAESLQLAVARGAAYFGLVRRGLGVRIGGGAARTYYLGLGGEPATALCIVPRGMEEGQSVGIADRELELLANRPVTFPLYTATDRSGERAGELVRAAPDALSPLPPLRTVVRFGRKLAERALPVHLEVRLTEIGTLELWCRSLETEHRWRLEFRLRDIVGPAPEPAAAGAAALVVEPVRLDEASALLRATVESGDDPVTLTRRLEAALDAGRNGGTSGSGSRAGSRPASSSTSSSSSARPCSAAGRAAGRAPGHRSSVRCGRRSGAANACLPRSARSSAVSSCRKPSVGARPSPSSGRSLASARACRSTGRSTASSRATRLRRGRSACSPPSGRAPRPTPSRSRSSRAPRATAGATSTRSCGSGSRAGSRPPRTASVR